MRYRLFGYLSAWPRHGTTLVRRHSSVSGSKAYYPALFDALPPIRLLERDRYVAAKKHLVSVLDLDNDCPFRAGIRVWEPYSASSLPAVFPKEEPAEMVRTLAVIRQC